MNHYSRFQQDKLLSSLSTFGIGGPARYFIEISIIGDMQEILAFCHQEQLPFIVIGKGSNSLFDDKGFNGLVILNKIAFIEQTSLSGDLNEIHAGSGYNFSLLGVQTARKGWTGLEFASGIPASVGGAIFMNAGANGTETCDHLTEVTFVSETGELFVFKKEELNFAYRTSSFQKKKGAIVSGRFILHKSEDARPKQLKIVNYRTKTQPYGDKSAGCVFRNPPEKVAGALIQQCGLKGSKLGGAEVSLLHGNFIVNKEGASAKDVMDLAFTVQKTVKEQTGIELEMEIRRIPYDI